MTNTDINLLKNELAATTVFSSAKKLLSLYIFIAVIAAEALAYGGMMWYSRSLEKQQAASEAEGSSVNLEIGRVKGDLAEATRYQQRLSNLDVLLKDHVFWSPAFAELSKYTYKNITYATLSGNIDEHKAVVTGTAASFTDIGKLIIGLKQSPKIKDVMFQSSGESKAEKSGYAFIVEIIFDPGLFKKGSGGG